MYLYSGHCGEARSSTDYMHMYVNTSNKKKKIMKKNTSVWRLSSLKYKEVACTLLYIILYIIYVSAQVILHIHVCIYAVFESCCVKNLSNCEAHPIRNKNSTFSLVDISLHLLISSSYFLLFLLTNS